MTLGYHPATAVWDVVVKDDAGTLLPVQQIDRSHRVFLRSTMEPVRDGELRLVVQGNKESVTIPVGKTARNGTLYELDTRDLPAGSVFMTLECWVDGEKEWMSEPQELRVGRLDGSVTNVRTNPAAGTLDVAVHLSSDGPLDDVHLFVDAIAKAVVWDSTAKRFSEIVRSRHRFDLDAICRNVDGERLLRIPLEEGPEMWRVELSVSADPEVIAHFPPTTATFAAWSSDVILTDGMPNPIETSPLETRRDWEEAISGIERRYEGLDISQGTVLFAGSSSIRIWESLEQDFPGLPVVNAGFGGSRINETTQYADRIIFPFNPHTMLFYAGSNDIAGGFSPERVFADYVELVKTVHAKLPKTRIIFISIAPSPGRWAQHPRVIEANRLIRMYSETDERLDFIDVYPLMLGEDGLPMPHLYRDDRVHMSEHGYALWTAAIRPYLGLA